MADFTLIARRVLDEEEHRLFRIYHLLGADWRLCRRQMNVERGAFFHTLSRIERKVGQAFAETEPYALYPLDEYFGGVTRDEPVRPAQPTPIRKETPIRIRLPRAA